MKAIKDRTTIKPGGRIELVHPEIPVGTPVEVNIVFETGETPGARNRARLCEQGGGCFDSVEEIDAFIAAERDRWSR